MSIVRYPLGVEVEKRSRFLFLYITKIGKSIRICKSDKSDESDKSDKSDGPTELLMPHRHAAISEPYGAVHLGEVHRRTWLPLSDPWDGIVSLLDRLLVKKWGRGSTSERCPAGRAVSSDKSDKSDEPDKSDKSDGSDGSDKSDGSDGSESSPPHPQITGGSVLASGNNCVNL